MGLLDWLKVRGKSEEAVKPSRTHSIFSDFPDRVLKTQADVKKDDALLEMTLVVNEIANDPDTNWQKYKGDFEKAVTGMRDAFDGPAPAHDEEKTVRKGDADRNKDARSAEPPVPIDVVWESGSSRRRVREPEENNHYTIYTQGFIGKSSEGFHHRVDVVFVKDDFDRTDYMRGDWSHAVPTQDAAMRGLKAAMVTQDRQSAEWTGQDKGAGSQSIAIVSKAVKEGRFVNRGAEVSRSETEKKPQVRERQNYRDR
jgi:hypothetical protein